MTEQHLEELIEKYAQGTASEAEIRLLKDWYQSSPIAEVPWTSTNGDEESQVYHRMLQRMQKEIHPKQKKIFRLSPLQVAALFLLVIGMGLVTLWYKNAPPAYITLSNPAQKIQEVRLPDGSVAWLNAASTIRYQKEFKEHRDIKLEGEAFFRVTPDAAHPFTVDAGGVQTKVIGTSFNIKAYKDDDSTHIAVVTGKVRVGNTDKELAQLEPSTQFSIHRQKQIGQTVSVDTTAITAWRQGKLFFDGKPLSEIIKTLERWYGVPFQLDNEDMGNCRFHMSIDNHTPLQKLLRVMSEVGEMNFSINNQTGSVTLSGKGCPK